MNIKLPSYEEVLEDPNNIAAVGSSMPEIVEAEQENITSDDQTSMNKNEDSFFNYQMRGSDKKSGPTNYCRS